MFIYSAQSNQGGNGEKFREKKNGISYFWKSLCFTIFVIFKHFKGPLWAIIQENDNQKKKTNKKQMIQRHPYLQILIDEHQSTELCFEPSKFYIIICSFSFFCSIWQWRKIWFSSGIAVMQCNYSYWFFFSSPVTSHVNKPLRTASQFWFLPFSLACERTDCLKGSPFQLGRTGALCSFTAFSSLNFR